MSDGLLGWLATASRATEPPDTEAALRAVEAEIGYQLPDAVHRVLSLANRPAGFNGESYIAFFNADDLILCWRDAQKMALGFVPFASNGGGEWYGLDSRLDAPSFVQMPAIGIDWSDATFLGATWDEFWETLRRGPLFDRKYHPE